MSASASDLGIREVEIREEWRARITTHPMRATVYLPWREDQATVTMEARNRKANHPDWRVEIERRTVKVYVLASHQTVTVE
jgi:hypothetical protein